MKKKLLDTINISSVFRYNRNQLLVCLISVSYALLLLSGVISTIIHKPKDTVNMMVGHYYEDYYEYLSFIKQGQEGNIFLQNLFTSDDRSKLFIPWWSYSVIGLISLILPNNSTVYSYWFASFILLSLTFILTYKIVSVLMQNRAFPEKIITFLLIVFSSSFYLIKFTPKFEVLPFDYWFSQGSPFSRYNMGTPHHEFAQLIFLLSILLTIRIINVKNIWLKYGVFFVTLCVLFFCASSQLILFSLAFISAYIVSINTNRERVMSFNLFDSSRIIPYLFVFLAIAPIAYLINKYFQSSPTYLSVRNWDITHYYYPSIAQFVQSFGPLFLLGLAGAYRYFAKLSFPRLFLFFISFYTVFISLIPVNIAGTNILSLIGIHNLRINTSVAYIFFGIGTVELFKMISKKCIVFYALAGILFLFYTLSFHIYWKQAVDLPRQSGYLQYMPKIMYDGIKTLEKDKSGKVVLASPKSSLGLAIPAISGHRVYFGRSIFTLDFDEKLRKANKIYNFEIDTKEVNKLLIEENIGYVVVTFVDNDLASWNKRYPFLKPVYTNSNLTILAPSI
ncbi:hypothetical protein COV53_05280 [Candidatus Gottesmanbacteria bacterium CG11_big_fil_rev_8_21_14_0_20_37_11]|uniref:Glycosyltransferase RgtA/B/C/D-like domain-containing protein n=3 Tax=Candidatus Gottesmaniibacteriota TaxID=1752720 RepID=A0A2M7RR73_9BACT|nr:MAG: hypothetical protein AUJ73_03990 [Candidatus Gottesmanbacteria bacterium CG1_02_37_22]PIP32732.1 MAG: hypothetical protein COX23_03145 [Candidatus Gottesmanbacteria bacterium CG23_combo_of_CG06-09_8_20_14_all_37_19]PIR08012.1 MAG: hypothetical protein COV53_05280 [Candidatus Gottesmanbacteria bacterium CG11_big_fil_rev_8_21_14_0_20_37_11]PIZ02798.1 MAG: hypothetical protein COY59_02860 [Candidatus Gottesmanbacteria bacterium CG_4_10_14_0_8_um_filter_37_24]